MIDLRQFRQFIAVAETLSFRRAAERLHMAQPPLSAAIRKLEDELGVVLFERDNRGTALTPAGDAFLLEARRALERARARGGRGPPRGAGLGGTLRLRFVDSTVNALLPLILRAFQERHPDVDFQLEEGTTAKQCSRCAGTARTSASSCCRWPMRATCASSRCCATGWSPRCRRSPARTAGALRLPNWRTNRGSCLPRTTGRHARADRDRMRAGRLRAAHRPAAAPDATTAGNRRGRHRRRADAAPVRADATARHYVLRTAGAGSPLAYELAIAYRTPSPLVDALRETARSAVRRLGWVLAA